MTSVKYCLGITRSDTIMEELSQRKLHPHRTMVRCENYEQE